MRVLAFRHSPSDGLGLIGDVMKAHGIAWEYVDLYQELERETPLPDADALIVLGGSMSANDDLRFIHREIMYVREALEQGKPVLGICLGAQLIAKALGASVYSNATKEIGWVEVAFNDAVRNDPLFHDLDSEVIFQWHGETFDLPAGVELLASSAACRHQAFRLLDRIYGLQFHLEVTPDMILQWCREDEACGPASEAAEPIDPNTHFARTKSLAQTVFGRWCDLAERLVRDRARSAS